MYNNVFLYWIGYEYKVINLLRDLIYYHSNSGQNYKVYLITPDNLLDYIQDIPMKYFWNLKPAHQADVVRVYVIQKYGGIWLDSDTLVMSDLSQLFEIFDNKDGFLITQNDIGDKNEKINLWTQRLCNGIFGSKPNTDFINYWKSQIEYILRTKNGMIEWEDIGTNLLTRIKNKYFHLIENYQILNGIDNLYPVCWKFTFDEFIEKEYDNWKNIQREFQPCIILTNQLYKNCDDLSIDETPLSYFIDKSYSIEY